MIAWRTSSSGLRPQHIRVCSRAHRHEHANADATQRRQNDLKRQRAVEDGAHGHVHQWRVRQSVGEGERTHVSMLDNDRLMVEHEIFKVTGCP